jgi:hypothetical protein
MEAASGDGSRSRKRYRSHNKKSDVRAKQASRSSESSVGRSRSSSSVDRSESQSAKDTFYFALQCKEIENPDILWWHSPESYIPLATEASMIDVLVKWKKTERGMMKSQPGFRVNQIRKLCKTTGVPISQAASLRRHHMKRFNPTLAMSRLQLGNEEDIRESARLFEVAVDGFLRAQNVPFWTEEEHKDHISKHRKDGDPFPPTPDFILKQQVLLKKCRDLNRKSAVEERLICWVEAKMFYGASTIAHDGKSAVGCLMKTAKKYVRVYGQGAMVFMQGCGDRLAAELAEVGVIALDCSGNTVSLGIVEDHQRTWCGDTNGNILP